MNGIRQHLKEGKLSRLTEGYKHKNLIITQLYYCINTHSQNAIKGTERLECDMIKLLGGEIFVRFNIFEKWKQKNH